MTFEEEFPELIKCRRYKYELAISNILLHSAVDRDNIIKIEVMATTDDMNKWITEGGFYHSSVIQKHCIDKQKVLKLIQNWQPKKISGVYKSSYIKARLSYEYWLALEDLKKELGLDDTLFGMKIKTDSKLKENEFRLE